MTKEQEYTPFGEEWRKEIKRIPKDGIIDILENVCNENLKFRNASLRPPTAIGLIAAERKKQISKGYTVESDIANYNRGELASLANQLVLNPADRLPFGWDFDCWNKLCKMPYIDRVRIAATWMAKELEILLHFENLKEVNND